MNIWMIVGIGIIVAAICVLVKQYRPEFSVMISLCGGILLFSIILLQLSPVFEQIQGYMERASLSNEHFMVLVKSLGICYVASIASDTCKDAGQGAIAGKIELGAKAAVILLALPLFGSLVDYSLKLIEI